MKIRQFFPLLASFVFWSVSSFFSDRSAHFLFLICVLIIAIGQLQVSIIFSDWCTRSPFGQLSFRVFGQLFSDSLAIGQVHFWVSQFVFPNGHLRVFDWPTHFSDHSHLIPRSFDSVSRLVPDGSKGRFRVGRLLLPIDHLGVFDWSTQISDSN